MCIDKLEVMVPAHAPFTGDFEYIHRELRREPEFGPFRPSRHYRAVANLQPFGYDAILHLEQKRFGGHKLELLETGSKTYQEMEDLQKRIFDSDPMLHRVGRVDLCADVPGVPVRWFSEHMRVEFKRWICAHEKIRSELELSRMGRGRIETIYAGKRPRCVRIYDKVSERRYAYGRWCRRQIAQARQQYIQNAAHDRERIPEAPLPPIQLPELPTFDQWLAVESPNLPPAPVLTRVECMYGGGAPEQLETFAHIWTNAAQFNPFQGFRVLPGCEKEPDFYAPGHQKRYKYSMQQWCAGMWLREHVADLGAAQLDKMLSRDGNRKWAYEKFADFLPSVPGEGVTVQKLYDNYRAAVTKQLAA